MKGSIFQFLFIAVLLGKMAGCAGDRTITENNSTRISITKNMVAEFLNPPDYVKVRACWWWLNSNITKDCITKDLEAMKANGYGGAIIIDAGSPGYDQAKKTAAGPAFLSDRWLELLAHSVREADRLGLELSLNVQSGSNMGSPSVTPQNAMKKITNSEIVVEGPSLISIELPMPPNLLLYSDIRILAVKNASRDSFLSAGTNPNMKNLDERKYWTGIYPIFKLRDDYEFPVAVVQPSEIIDVTTFFSNEKLIWDVPDGKWTILRFGMTCTGVKVSAASDGWEGLSIDPLSKKALLEYDTEVISKLISNAKSAGNALKYIYTGSWQPGEANWTDNLMEKFKTQHGYDMTPYLPVLANRIVESSEISNRFLHDYSRTISDLIATDFHKTLSQIAQQNGIYTHSESGRPKWVPVDFKSTMGFNTFPMDEFWVDPNTLKVTNTRRLNVKQGATSAGPGGLQFAAGESPTGIDPHWQRSPKDCKNAIDQIFCSGVSTIFWHNYTASPDEFGEPGNEYFGGIQLNRHVTWWNESKAFIEYINRCSYLLSQGLHKADILYYSGDNTPDFEYLKEDAGHGLGYDWGSCSYDMLINRVKISNGKIILPDGMSYSVLVLPSEKVINAELLKKLEALVYQGLVLIGPKPKTAAGLMNYPDSDRQVQEIASRLWGKINGKEVTENKLGKGRVFYGKSISDILRSVNIMPDFGYTGTYPDTQFDYIHRSTNSDEIYFVVNQLAHRGNSDSKFRNPTDVPDHYESLMCKFRVTGKTPELWDPMNGKIRKINIWYEENGYTYLPLHFNPEGSVFVVFRDQVPENHITSVRKNGEILFPGVKMEAGMFPDFEFFNKDNALFASVSLPGKYLLKWSDGKEISLSVENPVITRGLNFPWTLKFLKEYGPTGTLTLDSLKSWTDFGNENIRYYSGGANYFNKFRISENELTGSRILLDLGKVQEIAAVQVNGKSAGVCWIAPFMLNITNLVKPGENELRVTVVNSWVNRMIGDSYILANKRFTKSNVTVFENPDNAALLRKSGLLGGAKLIFRKEIKL